MDAIRSITTSITARFPVRDKHLYEPLSGTAVELQSPVVPTFDISSAEHAESLTEDLESVLEAFGTSYKHEIKVYLGYMGPLFVNQILSRYCAVLGPISTMGKFGAVHLAGASLANTTLNILGIAPSLGITSALDTLSTQAHGGSLNGKTRDLNMLYCLRVALVSSICLFPLLILICFFEPVFLLLRVEADAAHIAAQYMRCGAIGMPAFLLYECLRKYAQAKGLFLGPALAVVGAAPFSIWLMHTTIFGINTPPIALALFFILSLLGEIVWAVYYLPKHTLAGLPSFHLVSQDLGLVFKLGAAGVINVCSDWFAWEYLTFASAWLGTEVLAANSVFLASATFFYALPNGLRNGASTRVGNYLGRNAPEHARVAAVAALGVGAACALITATAMGLNSKTWSRVFTDDPAVTLLVQKVMPFFCIIVAFDAIQGVYSGILQGAGMPMEIARIMIVGHWFIGLPMATLFAFTSLNLGLLGLWSGFGVGLGIACTRLAWLVLKNDWDESARLAQAHIKTSTKRAQELNGDVGL